MTAERKRKPRKRDPLPADRILRIRVVEATVGLGSTQIDELEKAGEFPKRMKISEAGRAIGWFESEVMAYLAKRKAARDGAQS